MSATEIKLAVVTGANKGIGFGVVKLLLQRWEDSVVYATARYTERGQKAVQELEQVSVHKLRTSKSYNSSSVILTRAAWCGTITCIQFL